MTAALWAIGIVVVLLVFMLPAAIKVVRQYERGVILRLGRFIGIKEPGVRLIIPFIDRMLKVDTRETDIDIPEQEVTTRDDVAIAVNAVVRLRVINPEDAVLEVVDYTRATRLISEVALRDVLCQYERHELPSQRHNINAKLQQIVDEQTSKWGVKVSAVDIKDMRRK